MAEKEAKHYHLYDKEVKLEQSDGEKDIGVLVDETLSLVWQWEEGSQTGTVRWRKRHRGISWRNNITCMTMRGRKSNWNSQMEKKT